MSAFDEAVERVGELAAVCAIDDPERRKLEAVRALLASYALAIKDLAAAGVSADRLSSVVERGWRDAAVALDDAFRVNSG